MIKPPNNKTEKFLSGPEFRAWRVSRGYSPNQAGALLGISGNAVRLYEKNGISRKDALAISALENKLEPYQPTEEDLHKTRIIDALGR